MIKFNNLMLLLTLVFIFSACEKSDDESFSNDIDYIKYGTSFGECLGYCKNDITVTNSKIDFHKSGWDLEGLLPEISIAENVDSKYTSELIGKIDFYAFSRLDSVIGCPDCADGGAEWIEIKSKEKTYKVIFEYRNEPEELQEYIGYLRTYLNAFQVDLSESIDFNDRVLINQQGKIKEFIGAHLANQFQYVIEIINSSDTIRYFDRKLDSDYFNDDLSIDFCGVLQYDSTMIYHTQPHNMPKADFKVRNIYTFDLENLLD